MTVVEQPPLIDGYEAVGLLRKGGFAVVYRYRQARTERVVAVKVLNARLTDEGVGDSFLSEARLMAQLSSHPHIVTILEADVTEDDRPYLVMEYCSGDDLSVRVKREPLPVAEALRVGVQIAGAVETAHRAGILHRDIKPANVLTTDFGAPALTDFGISSAAQHAGDLAGLSVPWSPPEAIKDPNHTSVASDVYSLAATVWHLLAGHSPFHQRRGPNGLQDYVHRINTVPVPRTGRPDVPAGVERVLAAAMAKDPAERPASVETFARWLQGAETQAGYVETKLLVRSAEPIRRPEPSLDDEAPQTRIRGMVTVEAQPEALSTEPAGETGGRPTLIRGVPTGPSQPAPVPDAEPVERTWGRAAPPPPVDDTQVRAQPATPEVAAPVPAPRPTSRRHWVLAGAAAVVVGGGVAAAVIIGGGGGGTPSATGPSSQAGNGGPAVTSAAVVPTPSGLAGARQPDGSVVFTWQTPDAAAGDQWVVRRADPGADTTAQLVGTPTFTVTGLPAGRQACIDVAVRRSDGRTSATPAQGCAG